MTAKAFFDTNILIYALSDQDKTKNAKARKIMDNGGVLSSQVVAETCLNLKRKINYPEDLLEKCIKGLYSQFQVIPLGEEIFIRSCRLREQYSLSYWDSLIIAAALEAHCDTLYSEDLHHGQQFGNTKIVNPFIPLK
jgi:predicted nucleic acid-binding protein